MIDSSIIIFPVVCAALLYCNVDRCKSELLLVVEKACIKISSNKRHFEFQILYIKYCLFIQPAKNIIELHVSEKESTVAHFQ